jgi:hypothetical protein
LLELWVRIGDGGEYESFGDDLDAAIGLLNECGAGQVTDWRQGGCDTVNFWGHDYISLYWGNSEANWESDLDDDERAAVGEQLSECYL